VEKEVSEVKAAFKEELSTVKNSKDVERLKVLYLGKRGPVQALIPRLGKAPVSERPHLGKLINDLKEEIASLCDAALSGYEEAELSKRLNSEAIDITLPGRRRYEGRKHPLTQILDECISILGSMGFSVQYAPDIDTDYYNYEALNFPANHPARDMQDTFYLTDSLLLRSHTSNTQIHVMENHSPPIRIIAPGSSFRNENISARSHVFFHQIEALHIDQGVSFADLLSTLNEFLSRLFKKEMETRFRPSYFPFVEPGVEPDIRCTVCEGAGCPLCKQTGWLEIGGAGMVHPNVLEKGGIDPERYSGYAWGLGIERLAMLRWNIRDIRLFFENDMRFLAQF